MTPRQLHPRLYRSWARKTGTSDAAMLLRHMEGLVSGFLEDGKLLGTGGEGLVYRDGHNVKKFILNWEGAGRDIDLTGKRLAEMSSRIGSAMHLYRFAVKRLGPELLLLEYPYEESESLTKAEVRTHWKGDLEKQFLAMQNVLLATGYYPTNMTLYNLRLATGVLKFTDYGCDCVPLIDALVSIGRMQFMLLSDIYDLGPP